MFTYRIWNYNRCSVAPPACGVRWYSRDTNVLPLVSPTGSHCRVFIIQLCLILRVLDRGHVDLLDQESWIHKAEEHDGSTCHFGAASPLIVDLSSQKEQRVSWCLWYNLRILRKKSVIFFPNLAENIFDVRITVIFLQGSGEKDSKSLLITSRGKISFVTIMKTLWENACWYQRSESSLFFFLFFFQLSK